jgi:hypothetical protein
MPSSSSVGEEEEKARAVSKGLEEDGDDVNVSDDDTHCCVEHSTATLLVAAGRPRAAKRASDMLVGGVSQTNTGGQRGNDVYMLT